MSAARRAFTVAALAALLTGLVYATARGAGPLQFTIALASPSYPSGHPVPLEMKLGNASAAPVRVNGRLAVNDASEPAAFREVTFDIRTPSGNHAAFRADIKIGAARSAQLIALAPHGSIRKTVDLARYYAIGERGRYEVHATYASAAPRTFTGPLASNVVTFTVR